MASEDQAKWDRRYRAGDAEPPSVAHVLKHYAHLLPNTGTALDLACGRGGNAIFLAEYGLDTHAWDISSEVLTQLQHRTQLPNLQTRIFDAEHENLPVNHFDVIVVSRYLLRELFPALICALKPAGLLYYQTFIADKVESIGPSRDAYLLQPNELLHSFQTLQILAYREEGQVGDATQGFRNEAMLVARKASSCD